LFFLFNRKRAKLMKKIFAGLTILSFAFTSIAQAQTSGTSAANANTQASSAGGSAALQYAPVTNGTYNTNYAANSALAPGLVAGIKTCSGSSSVGGSGRLISLSFGSTWKDEDCQAGEFGQQLWNEGYKAASIGVLCSRDVIRYAISTTGGIPYLRKDGTIVHRACPMKQKDWEAAGEPLLDPISGTPLTAEELNPPIRVVAETNTVGALTDAQQAALLAKLSPEQKAKLATYAKIESIEDHAHSIAANQTTDSK
jgi:hypothetical protein